MNNLMCARSVGTILADDISFTQEEAGKRVSTYIL